MSKHPENLLEVRRNKTKTDDLKKTKSGREGTRK